MKHARQVVVVLDLWDLGGPTYARIIEPRVTLRDLLDEAHRHVSEPFDVYLGGTAIAIEDSHAVSVKDGALFSFVRAGTVLCWCFEIDRFLLLPDEWIDSPRRIRQEQPSDHWLVIRPDSAKLLAHPIDSDDSLHEVIATQMHQRSIHVSIGMPVSSAGLEVVFDGYRVSKIIAAAPRSESIPEGPPLGTFVFLDARQTGRGVTFRLVEAPLFTLRPAAESLHVRIVPGFRIFAEHPRLQMEGLPVVNEVDPNSSCATRPISSGAPFSERSALAATFDELSAEEAPADAARISSVRQRSEAGSLHCWIHCFCACPCS